GGVRGGVTANAGVDDWDAQRNDETRSQLEHPLPATGPRPITSRPKDDNWDLHEIAEKRSELSLLLRGQLPRERYVALLGQAWLEAVALDGALTGACAARADIDALVEPDQHFAPHAREDLDYLKGPARPEPTPGTARFVAFVQEHRG